MPAILPDPSSPSAPVNTALPARPPRWSVLKRHKGKIFLGLVVIWLGWEISSLPFGAIAEFKGGNPGETEFMKLHRARAKEAGRTFHRIQVWVPLRDIPREVVNAVIVAEDGLFWTHGGFDWFEVRESLVRNITEGRFARGGSTITQQLVKNLFLSPSKNPLRKFREWILTWYMEQTLSKSRILELYLNVIEFGEGIYGIEAASRIYFEKEVQALTREEGARLAAVIPNPRRHRPNDSSQYVLRRTDEILRRMTARGM